MAFRKGQWVKLTRDIKLGRDTEPAGTVGIHIGPAMIQQTEGEAAEAHPTMREVHLVHHEGGEEEKQVPVEVKDKKGNVTIERVMRMVPYRGGDTRKVTMIEEADLEAVLDRNDIPADRLSTYNEEWVPLP